MRCDEGEGGVVVLAMVSDCLPGGDEGARTQTRREVRSERISAICMAGEVWGDRCFEGWEKRRGERAAKICRGQTSIEAHVNAMALLSKQQQDARIY